MLFLKARRLRFFQHVEMDVRIFMPRETDIANLSRLPGLKESFYGAFRAKDPVRIVETMISWCCRRSI